MATTLKPSAVREEFRDATTGWGADSLDDLEARNLLLVELFTALGGFTAAEQKISDAIAARATKLRTELNRA